MALYGHKYWTTEEEELMQSLINQGKSYQQIGDALGRTASAIANRLWWKCKQTEEQTTAQKEPEIYDAKDNIKTEKTILDVAKETVCCLGYNGITRIEYRNAEAQESATVRATDDSGNAISVVIIKHGKEG